MQIPQPSSMEEVGDMLPLSLSQRQSQSSQGKAKQSKASQGRLPFSRYEEGEKAAVKEWIDI
jgi:hypothetical protein